MSKKQKIRVAIEIITKSVLFIIFFIVSMFLAICVAILLTTFTISQKNIKNNEIITNQVDEVSIKIDTRIEEPKVSTMQLMITRKETAKGDRAEKLIQKAILKKRKKAILKAWLNSLYTPKNVEIMAHLMEGEAGDQNNKCQQATGQVVLNRVKSKKFKQTTIEDIVFAPGQYACILDGNYYRKPSKRAYKNAIAVLTGNVCIKVPKKVVYQSQFEQGSGIWKQIGTELFCFE